MAGILDILNVVSTVVDRVIPDPKDKLDLQRDLAAIADKEQQRQHDELMGQVQTNVAEASNPSVFVAGWRPAIGWTCAAGFAYSTMLAPMLHLGMPDLNFLQDVLLGMLGLTGGMRTYEKVKGVATEAVGNKEAGKPNAPFVQPQKRKKFLGIF